MKGMLIKECCIMSSLSKTYLIMLAVFVALSATRIYDGYFISSMFTMIMMMMPISGFAYDEQAGWDKYAAATPAGRKGVVQSKYLFVLLLSVATFVIGLLLNLEIFVLRPSEGGLGEVVVFTVSALCIGVLVLAVLMPLIFKFGSQRSRVLLIAVIAGVSGVGGALMAVGALSGALKQLAHLLSLLLPAIALGALAISYFISMRIYQRKEL